MLSPDKYGTSKCPATPLVKIAIMPFHRTASFSGVSLPPHVQVVRDNAQRTLTQCVRSSRTRAVLAWNYQMQDVRDKKSAHRCFWNCRINNSTNRLLGMEWAARLASRFGFHDARDDRKLANHCFFNWRIDNSMNRLLGLEWATRVEHLEPQFGVHDGLWAGSWPNGVGQMDLPPIIRKPDGIRDWGLLDKVCRTHIVRNFNP